MRHEKKKGRERGEKLKKRARRREVEGGGKGEKRRPSTEE